MPPKRQRPSEQSRLASRPASSSAPSKRAKSSPQRRGKWRKTERSIWNSKDDWETLVAESGLSTSSVSTRQARPRGLQTLVDCSCNAAARGFKRLWGGEGSNTSTRTEDGFVVGREWKAEWAYIPDHLREKVRDAVFRWWGGYLSIDILSEIFSVPPTLHLPGDLLPSIAQAKSLKPFDAHPTDQDSFTTLILTHATQVSDIAIARRIHFMPSLRVINLKGCSLAGGTTVKTILSRCPYLRRINLKGTKIDEDDVQLLLEKYGTQLEGFKVDLDTFERVHHNAPTTGRKKDTASKQLGVKGKAFVKAMGETFASAPYERLTHLCLPGGIINSPPKSVAAQVFGTAMAYPTPRPAPPDARFNWCHFGTNFPALTHLYLPGLLIPPGTTIDLPLNTLVKLSFGAGGPPVPIRTLIHLVASHCETLWSVDIGHILPETEARNQPREDGFMDLGLALAACTKLDTFRLRVSPTGSKNNTADQGMARYSDLIYGTALIGSWRRSLKRLSLIVPQPIQAAYFFPHGDPLEGELSLAAAPPLEDLELPSANIDDTSLFARALSGFTHLRSLDLSGTTIQEDDMRLVLGGCPLLSRVDLTSCRGINVRHRRNIFQAFE